MSTKLETRADQGGALVPATDRAIAMSTIIGQAAPMPAPTPMHMLQTALERGADISQMQQLMDLQERWEATEARKEFVSAMAEFKSDPPTIYKNKHVHFTSAKGTTDYYHAGLDDVCEAAIFGLANVGISHRWTIKQEDGCIKQEGGDIKQEGARITVTCILTHRRGHSESTSMTGNADHTGNKNALQALSSATAYLQRYTLLAGTGLSTTDADDDGRKGGGRVVELISQEQAADITALATEVGAKLPQFLKYLKISRLDELPAGKFRSAIAALESKRKS